MKIHRKPKRKSFYYDPYPNYPYEDPCNYLDDRREIVSLSNIDRVFARSTPQIILNKRIELFLYTEKYISSTLAITDMLDGSKWLS
ncbi:g016 [Yersinia phage phiR1-37]|uniref:hypothetical protein n=1 Tax=Yersinia phage phiR1-37 TaxID=331278 RepID=UPI00022DBCBC|nr:hypothetical protein phiR1-37_gp016 [Yersinia phage phiR1-37]CCE26040.1 g016 [Yersinia phage phiR1-37]